MMKKLYILTASVLLLLFDASAQKEYADVKKGNRLYEKEQFTDAEVRYRNALLKNPKSGIAAFNLGNSLYRQGKFENARNEYEKVAASSDNAEIRAQAFHNIGNTYMNEKRYAESIAAYKESLRQNPADNETRYNLALANALRRKEQSAAQQNQPQNQQQDINKQNRQDQTKQSDQPQQRNKNIEEDDGAMTKENAQQILDAFSADERATQEKVNRSKTGGNKRNIEKDW